MSLLPSFLGDKKLGVANGKHRYDLPLNNDEGAKFMVTLIGVMTFLMCMMMAGYFVIGKTTRGWVSGLTDRITIEIPIEGEDGSILSKENMEELAQTIKTEIEKLQLTSNAEILSEKDLTTMVKPWLGDNILQSDIPLPTLITLTLTEQTPEVMTKIRKTVKKISPKVTIDGHEDWISDLTKLTGGFQWVAALITMMIAIASIIALVGAMRMRLALHKDDIELLHLMGAGNHYIMRQFQRHGFALTLKGGGIGTVIALIIIAIIHKIMSQEDNDTMYGGSYFQLDLIEWLILIAIPLALSIIALHTTRYTVLRSLDKMP